MIGDVVLTAAALALFGAVLGPVVGALVWMSKQLLSDKDRHLEALARERDNEAQRRREADDRVEELLEINRRFAESTSRVETALTILVERVSRMDGARG